MAGLLPWPHTRVRGRSLPSSDTAGCGGDIAELLMAPGQCRGGTMHMWAAAAVLREQQLQIHDSWRRGAAQRLPPWHATAAGAPPGGIAKHLGSALRARRHTVASVL